MFLVAINQLQPSVVQGTAIATVNGLVLVEKLSIGNTVLGFDTATKTAVQTPVIALNKRTTNSVVLIITDQDVVIAATDQQLFDPVANSWIAAANLTADNYLIDSKGDHIKCRASTTCNAEEEIFTVFDISTTDPHNFFATESQLLTHNVTPFAVGVAFAFGETLSSISLVDVVIGAGAFFVGLVTGKVSIGSAKPDVNFKNPLDNKDTRDHIRQNKHNWSKLVPDPNNNNNWDKIAEIIATVMATGVHRLEGKTPNVYIAAANICNRIVEVKYIIKDGVEIISNAWVK